MPWRHLSYGYEPLLSPSRTEITQQLISCFSRGPSARRRELHTLNFLLQPKATIREQQQRCACTCRNSSPHNIHLHHHLCRVLPGNHTKIEVLYHTERRHLLPNFGSSHDTQRMRSWRLNFLPAPAPARSPLADCNFWP